jgi:hypothetical protein
MGPYATALALAGASIALAQPRPDAGPGSAPPAGTFERRAECRDADGRVTQRTVVYCRAAEEKCRAACDREMGAGRARAHCLPAP